MSVYAYVCTLCHHLATDHRLTPEAASVVDGPYVCNCGCEIDQRTPLSGIGQAACAAKYGR